MYKSWLRILMWCVLILWVFVSTAFPVLWTVDRGVWGATVAFAIMWILGIIALEFDD